MIDLLADALDVLLPPEEYPMGLREAQAADLRAALRERGVYLVTVEGLARALHLVHSWNRAIEVAEADAILAALGDEA